MRIRTVTALLGTCLVMLVAAVSAGPAAALISTGDGTWFWRTPQPAGNFFSAVSSVGFELWTVGDGGAILHSVDDGATWQPQLSGTTQSLNDVTFLDALQGWAVGGNDNSGLGEIPRSHVILHTADGGLTWQSQYAPGTSDLKAVAFVDALNGWAAGDNGLVVRTRDGGATWQAVSTGSRDWFTCLRFTDAEHGWVGGSEGAVLRTRDGGLHWQRLPLGRWAGRRVIVKPAFADAARGWAILQRPDGYSGSGSGPSLAATSDGGSHWRPLATPKGFEFSALVVDGQGTLWAAAMDDATSQTIFLRSSDAGAHWSREYADVAAPQAITRDAGGLCAVGYGLLTRADGGAWLPRSSGGYPPTQLQMFGDRAGVGLMDALGSGGETGVMRTQDGVNWETIASVRASYPTGLAFPDDQHGWVVGTRGGLLSPTMRAVVLATADGGATWQQQYLSAPWVLPLGVSFPDAAHGWVVAMNMTARSLSKAGLLLATGDSGQTWQRQSLPSGFVATALDFRSSLEGWAVGLTSGGARSAHTVDGGLHWTLSSTTLRGVTPSTVWFLDGQHGWATGSVDSGDSSVVLATSDGGVTWVKQDPDSSYRAYPLSDVAFVDPLHGWLFAGDQLGSFGGGVWQTDDGGATWTAEESGVGYGVTDASIAEGQVYATGLDGFLSTRDRAGDSAPPSTYDDFDGRYHRSAVAIDLVAADVGGGSVASTQYRVDEDATWHEATGPIEFPAPADHSGDGRHELYYRSSDTSGNVESSRPLTVPIDTLGPATQALGPTTVARGKSARLLYIAHEATSPKVHVIVKVRNAGGHLVRTLAVPQSRVNRAVAVSFPCQLRPGRYSFTVYARDLAGNAQVRAGRGWLVVKPSGWRPSSSAAMSAVNRRQAPPLRVLDSRLQALQMLLMPSVGDNAARCLSASAERTIGAGGDGLEARRPLLGVLGQGGTE